jgi:UDP-GlcNAc:undecaprenyl-phosphate GlcNAc-1-phosphate transferase
VFYEYLISFAVSFIIAFSTTPLVKRLSFKMGAVDVPKDGRRMHNRPIARLGGLAIILGFLISLGFNIIGTFFNIAGIALEKQLAGLLLGVLIIIVVGIVDDIKPISAKYKLIFQLIAAILVVMISDTRISSITNPFSELGISILSDYLSYPLTVLWIVGITNAINLIDGLDGLAAGVSSISYLSLFFISMMMGDVNTAVLIAILAGATLGFLPYNVNPAKIFMGDTGATFLGFTLAVISIQGTLKSYTAVSLAVPLLVLGLPLFDTAFAILRRLISGKPIMGADRGHLHHKLIDMGLNQKQSVVVMYTASAALGLCAIVLADKGALSAIILVISLAVFLIAGARFMSEIQDDEVEVELGEDINKT